jgi:hypothetical protein
MFELAQQLSYYLSVVDGGATSKLVSFGQQLASVSVIAQTAKASLASMIQPLEAVASAWTGREQQINNITRSLRQYQYVGQSIVDINRDIARSMPGASAAERGAEFTQVYNRQFEQGRQVARSLIRDMNQMAAILPGEANDYMQTFSTSLPFLSQGRGMTDQRAARLSSYLTAGGIAGGIDAQQSGRDLMQFLTTGPHMTDRSWTEVWSQYATRNNGQRVSAEQIRGMTTTQRIEILENISRQLQPMMDATGDSYEALKGTLNSFRHELYLFITEPIFDAWKGILRASATQFTKLNDAIGPVLRTFAAFAATGLDAIQSKIKFAVEGVTMWFRRMPQHLERFGNVLVAVNDKLEPLRRIGASLAAPIGRGLGHARSYISEHTGLTGLQALTRFFAPEILVLALNRFFGLALGPIGFVITSMFSHMLLGGGGGDLLNSFVSAMQLVGPTLLSAVGGLYRLYNALLEVTSVFLEGGLVPIVGALVSALAVVIEVVTFLGLGIAQVVSLIMLGLMPLFTAFSLGFDIITMFFSALLSTIFSALGVNTSMFDLVDALRSTAAELRKWTQDVKDDFRYLLREAGLITQEEYQRTIHAAAATSTVAVPEWLAGLQRRLSWGQFDIEEGGGAHTGQAPPNRPQVHQDFRYSRFDITQKFADGFSPERVAAAFVGDLESMASQQLASGYGLAFSNGG